MDHRLVQLANELADLAGGIIRPYFRAPIEAQQKGDLSPVTIADREAEQAMRALIAARYPTHGIHGEEFGRENPESPYRWVLDPIDGTRAFITGRPLFGTLIGLLHEGRPILGIIDQPVTGERWRGIDGQPTLFTGPFGGAAGTRACPALQAAELSATSPEMLGEGLPRYQRLANACRRVTWGGDCYSYGLLSLGLIDLIAERDLKIWDWAALVPIVEGAGGRMADWHGNTLREDGPGEALAVGDPALLAAAVAHLNQVG